MALIGIFNKAASIPPQNIRRIALIQPSRIGDIVFSLPTLAGLRELYPQAHIAWLVDDRCRELVEGHPDLNETMVIPFKALEQALKQRRLTWVKKELSRLKKRIREKGFDLSIDLHGLAKSALLVYMAGARYKIGSANTTGMKELSGFFSREIPPGPEDTHTIDRNLAVIKYLGGRVEIPQFKLHIPQNCKEEIQAILQHWGVSTEDKVIVLHPGAGWLSRRWPVPRYAELIHQIREGLKANIIVVGGAEGGSKEDGLFQELFAAVKVPVINLVHQLSLKQLMALLDRAHLFVGNEAGPMHLATALTKAVVAIIGPTRPELTGPYGPKARIIRQAVACSPCRQRNCLDLACMKAVEVSHVYEAVCAAWQSH
jgi:heptosyltransferase I